MRPPSLRVASLVLLFAEASSAQSASDRATAQALFDQARTQVEQGKYAEACPRFAESQRLDPGIGTLLYLGDCFEHLDKTASAWGAFREAESAAHASNQLEREKIASARARALEGKLSRLVIIVPDPAPGIMVRRDGQALASVIWGSPVPMDPGPHTVDAEAPGKRRWTMTIEVPKQAGDTRATVPMLETADVPPTSSASAIPIASAAPIPSAPPTVAPSASSAHEPSTTSASPSSWQPAATYVAFGVGGVGLLVGSIFGVQAMTKWHTAQTECNATTCSSSGVAATSSAKSSAALSTGFITVGVLGVGAGVALWAFSPSNDATTVSFGPGDVTLRGHFLAERVAL